MFKAKNAGSTEGAYTAYTLDGPPERIIASGFFALTWAAVIDDGTISE
jgi:hypothetical protein